MKKLIMITLALALLIGIGMVQADETGNTGEAKWFDMENCGMCKNLSAEKGLMQNMKWEQHNISNGVMSVCTVTPEFMEAHKRAEKNMEAMSKKLMSGEKIEMCGSCMALGSLFPKGLKHEKVDTENGGITLFTSDNPEVVKELHAWADKNAEEMKKMIPGTKESHDGHNH